MDLSKREILTALAAGAVLAVPAGAEDLPPIGRDSAVPFAVWASVNAAVQGYADCIDRFDIEGLMALFTDDCVYDYSPGLVMNGRAAVGEGARKSLANVERSSHSVGPPVVRRSAEPGIYLSVVYFTAVHQQKDGGHHTVWGRYLDTFRADASGGLLIAHRQTVSHLSEGISSPRYWLQRNPS